MPRGPNKEAFKVNKMIDTYADRGCKYATAFLGTQSHCLDDQCPFGPFSEGEDCVADMTPIKRQSYIKGFTNGEAKGLVAGLEIGRNIDKYTVKGG